MRTKQYNISLIIQEFVSKINRSTAKILCRLHFRLFLQNTEHFFVYYSHLPRPIDAQTNENRPKPTLIRANRLSAMKAQALRSVSGFRCLGFSFHLQFFRDFLAARSRPLHLSFAYIERRVDRIHITELVYFAIDALGDQSVAGRIKGARTVCQTDRQ